MGTSAEEFWDSHYGRHTQVWSGNPNGVLVDETSDLAPGTALDIGCGEGADAVWLARRGWSVTAVDVSRIAVDRGARAAEAAGVRERIDWQLHDLADTFPTGVYDLVSAQYLHSSIEFPRDQVLRKAASAVAAGGTLLVVGHAAAPPWARHHEDHDDQREFPGPSETARAIGAHDDDDSWDLVVCEVRERTTISPEGEPAVITDSVVKARRR